MNQHQVFDASERDATLIASLFPEMFAGLYDFGSFAAFLPHGEQYTSHAVWTDKEGRLQKCRSLDPAVASTRCGDLVANYTPTDSFQKLTHLVFDFFATLFPRAPVNFIDIGAFVGTKTIPTVLDALHSGLDITAYAIEPGPQFKLIDANMRLNGIAKWVHQVNAAATDTCCSLLYDFVPARLVGGNVLRTAKADRPRAIVKGIRVDSLGANMTNPTFVKMDTQGYEPTVISGMSKWLEHGQTVVFAEFHPWSLKRPIGPELNYRNFLHEHYVYELTSDGTISLIADLDAFAAEVSTRRLAWTDIVFYPKKSIYEELKSHIGNERTL